MIVLKRNGKPIAKTTTPVWTQLQTNGHHVICDRTNANGIVVDGTMYHIAGTPDNGCDTVILNKVPDHEAVEIEPTPEQKLQLAVAELGVATAQNKTEIQLAIAELAATMTGGTE